MGGVSGVGDGGVFEGVAVAVVEGAADVESG